MKSLATIKQLLRRVKRSAEAIAEGGIPVAMPPPGAVGEWQRETSTNAQMEGAADEPWSGNR